MNIDYRPTVDGCVEPSLREIVFGYYYNNLPATGDTVRYIREEAEVLTQKYFTEVNNEFN